MPGRLQPSCIIGTVGTWISRGKIQPRECNDASQDEIIGLYIYILRAPRAG
jgi:hypothetical protein